MPQNRPELSCIKLLAPMGSIIRSAGPFSIKRIAIIGAGPSGLAASKYLLAEGSFETIDVFEQQAEVGGVWNYTPASQEQVSIPQTTPDVIPDKPTWSECDSAPAFPNPMYDRLNTNIPKDLMRYSDMAFPEDSLLFPTREDVQDYLVKYSRDVRHLISFSTQIEDVELATKDGMECWKVTSKSTVTEEKTKAHYDAIVVGNGHYAVPFIPSVPGIENFSRSYPTIISHSKTYRSPDAFRAKKVIVVGSAASGLDIGTQISKICKTPLLNSVRTSSSLELGHESKKEVPPIAEYILEDRAVRFEDGSVEKHIDAIVYCTGYLYSYPFLKRLDPPIVTTGRRACGLYKQLFNIAHPTLAFIALPQKVIPFPVSEVQSAAIAKVWSNALELPTREAMEDLEREDIKEMGDGTHFHVFGYPKDARYINGLYDWVKTTEFAKEPPYWNQEQMWVRENYSNIRKKWVENGCTAKSIEEMGYQFRSGPN